MRVVVDGCASPKLRVAVETALDVAADDARMNEALESAGDERA